MRGKVESRSTECHVRKGSPDHGVSLFEWAAFRFTSLKINLGESPCRYAVRQRCQCLLDPLLFITMYYTFSW